MRKLNTTHCYQDGATLIEVLISLLVFSIGIYGVAAFQLQAVKESLDSGQSSRAVWIAQEAIDRIRANEAAYINGDYIAAFNNASGCTGAAPASCIDNTCTSTQMANFDAWEVTCDNPINNANIVLACSDNPCTALSDMTISMTWQNKAIADRQGEYDFDETVLQTQSYSQVFRP